MQKEIKCNLDIPLLIIPYSIVKIIFAFFYSTHICYFQINELMHVTIPVMLLPDDFRAYSKIKIDNHLFNKYDVITFNYVCTNLKNVFNSITERICLLTSRLRSIALWYLEISESALESTI